MYTRMWKTGTSTDTFRFTNVKLEKGNRATDWSPAPEDMATTDYVQTTYATKSSLEQTEKDITSSVEAKYLSKTDASSTYATKTQLKQTENSITATVSQVQTIADKAFAKASQVEQTADGIQVTLTEVEATADSAKTNASTALSTANSAKTTATNAAKTATNYLKFDSSGLCVGNMTGTLGYNTLIKSTGVDIRNGSTVLSSFGASEIALGANSASSSISLVGDSGYIKGSQYGTYGNLSLSSTGGVALVSGPRNSVSPSDNFLMVKQSGISLSALGGTGKTITFSSAYASGVLADFPVGRGHTGEWTWMTFASDIRIAWLVHGRWAFKANAQSYTDFTLPWTAHNAQLRGVLRTHELRLGLAAPRLHRGALHHHQRHHDQVPRQLLERLQFRLHVRRRNHGPRQAVGLKRKEKSMHGIMAGDVVVLTNDGSGMEVVDVPEPMSMGGIQGRVPLGGDRQ